MKDQMTWILFARLVLEIGLPAAQKVIAKWQSGAQVTAQDVQEVVDAAKVDAVARTKARLLANGIDPESERGKAILAHVDTTPIPDFPQTPV